MTSTFILITSLKALSPGSHILKYKSEESGRVKTDTIQHITLTFRIQLCFMFIGKSESSDLFFSTFLFLTQIISDFSYIFSLFHPQH